MQDDLVQYRSQKKGSFYTIYDTQTDLQEVTDDTLMTIQIVQDPIIDQYERSIFTCLEMIGQLGGLFEILKSFSSLLIGWIVQKFFTLSILKNLYYIERTSKDKDDKHLNLNHKISIQNRIGVNQTEMADEMKVDSIEDNNSSIIEGSQVNNVNKKRRWYRHETNKENVDFGQQEPESNENKISYKLSSIKNYAPNIKDYVYTVSKTVRLLTLCK